MEEIIDAVIERKLDIFHLVGQKLERNIFGKATG
jgi:hypothetical protein